MADGIERWTPAPRNSGDGSCRQFGRPVTRDRRWWCVGPIHRLGYRYRLHRKDLPGRPDAAFLSRRKATFVQGCFWHGHGCPKGRPPKSRLDYWKPKLDGNRESDRRNEEELRSMGWKRTGDMTMRHGRPQRIGPTPTGLSWLPIRPTSRSGRSRLSPVIGVRFAIRCDENGRDRVRRQILALLSNRQPNSRHRGIDPRALATSLPLAART